MRIYCICCVRKCGRVRGSLTPSTTSTHLRWQPLLPAPIHLYLSASAQWARASILPPPRWPTSAPTLPAASAAVGCYPYYPPPVHWPTSAPLIPPAALTTKGCYITPTLTNLLYESATRDGGREKTLSPAIGAECLSSMEILVNRNV